MTMGVIGYPNTRTFKFQSRFLSCRRRSSSLEIDFAVRVSASSPVFLYRMQGSEGN